MIDVDKIEDIRKRARRGQPVAAIARELHVSEPTVRKYRDMEDLSQGPEPGREPQSPSLDGLTEKIDAWLEDDVRQWRKQRHTAVRVYVRLRDEEGYQCVRQVVCRQNALQDFDTSPGTCLSPSASPPPWARGSRPPGRACRARLPARRACPRRRAM